MIVQPWQGFSAQKQFAVDQASNDRIFSLDADERVSKELRDEIVALKTSDRVADGYKVPRLSFYMGRAIRHGGWYPDLQLRFFDRRKGRWSERLVHESFQMDEGSQLSRLSGDILHFSVENAPAHHRMIGERYAPLAAKQMLSEGRQTSPIGIALAGPAAFIKTYFLNAGFLDGLPGLAIAGFAAHNAFLKHLLLWELKESNHSKH